MTAVSRVTEYLENVVPLWEVFKGLIPKEPRNLVQPYRWNGNEIIARLRPLGHEIQVGENVERRVLVPVNPGLKAIGLYATTHTIYVGFQIVMPGEVAGAHRHSPFAARFMIEGRASTVVDGTKVDFEAGDYVITPRWAWHDHTNEGFDPAIWLDVLDIPIPRMLYATFFEDYPEERQPVTVASSTVARGASLSVRPKITLSHGLRGETPAFIFKGQEVIQLLRDMARQSAGDPFDGTALTYVNPHTGGDISRTLGTYISLLKPGTQTRAHRHSMSVVNYVVRGRGMAIIDGTRFHWDQNDVLVVPPWTWHEYAGEDETILLSITDGPMLQNLGLYREEVHPAGSQGT